MKHVLKRIAQIAGGVYLAFNLLLSACYFAPASSGTRNFSRENRKYKLATDLREYLNYLSQNPIDKKADVDRVLPLQLMLQKKGYDVGADGPDGMYGSELRFAVYRFQYDRRHLQLPTNGFADVQTLKTLVEEILSDPVVAEQLDNELLAPYRAPEKEKFIQNLPEIFNSHQHWLLPVRPDVEAVAFYYMFARPEIKSTAKEALGANLNRHTSDAFRHAHSVLILSQTIDSAWAVELGDMREKADDDAPLGCMYMDLYNHRAAQKIAERLGSEANAENAVAEAIRSGELVRYPFPLIPSGLE